MDDAFLLGRVLLHFGDDACAEALIGNLSAIAFDPAGGLWLVSDELSGDRVMLSRLTSDGHGAFGGHARFDLADYIDLPHTGPEAAEADIEGLDYADHYLWFTGSHSAKRGRPKGRNRKKDLDRLAHVEVDANRCLLGRLPVVDGAPVRSCKHPKRGEETLTAARLGDGVGGNLLMEALQDDRHLGSYVREQQEDAEKGTKAHPGKENGLDIEGLAVFDERLLIGMRGPVLRGWAVLLEIEPVDQAPGRLALAVIADGQRYRKHFLDLDGLGIRELARDGDDLLIIAGPTMPLPGAQRLYRLHDASKLENDSFTSRDHHQLEAVCDLPRTGHGDHAEGLAAMRWPGSDGVLIVYDTPTASRRPGAGSVYADVFRLDPRRTGGAKP